MNFGTVTDGSVSFDIMNFAVEAGINFFDTADVYGWENGGLTESIIGRWLAEDKSRRDKIVLATKVHGKMGPGPNDMKLSAYHIRKACDESLRRLQTDHIDLYQMHHIDRYTPWEEIYQAMEQLLREGKIIYVGSSNFAAWNIAEAFYKAKEGRRTNERLLQSVEKLRPQIEAYEKLCAKINQRPEDVAVAWTLNNPVVTSPIIGPRTLEHLKGSIESFEIKLDEETLKKLDEIWPGPGSQAPQAYAW